MDGPALQVVMPLGEKHTLEYIFPPTAGCSPKWCNGTRIALLPIRIVSDRSVDHVRAFKCIKPMTP